MKTICTELTRQGGSTVRICQRPPGKTHLIGHDSCRAGAVFTPESHQKVIKTIVKIFTNPVWQTIDARERGDLVRVAGLLEVEA